MYVHSNLQKRHSKSQKVEELSSLGTGILKSRIGFISLFLSSIRFGKIMIVKCVDTLSSCFFFISAMVSDDKVVS